MIKNKLTISVIIPCRNEERFISRCLDSILAQDYPKDMVEVLIADGLSTDKTTTFLESYSNKYPFIRWIKNHKKLTSAALNIMILRAKGDIIIRLDAHNEYPDNYISKCVKYINEFKVDNVGGLWITLAGANTITARAIALALSSKFGVGNALFHTGVKEPKYVDTVPFGCYKREVFDRIGLFDETLWRNEDDEFNIRLIKSGGKILLVPDIFSYYYARETYIKLWRTYYQYGYFKPLIAIKLKGVFTLRQLAPVIFICSLVVLFIGAFLNKFLFWLFYSEVFIYLFINFIFSISISLRKGMMLLPFLVFSFAVLHFSYGIGYLKGILDFMILKKHMRSKIDDLPITR